VLSSELAPSVPAMCGRATFAIEESSTSMNVARVTVMATIHGLIIGFIDGGAVTGATSVFSMA
jgi:hypothetical protein